MKVIFDIDGTLTDFNLFIEKYGYPYFFKKYGMAVNYANELELADILDMDNFFMESKGVSLEEAKEMTKKATDEFWMSHRFILFSLLGKFREGVSDYINDLISSGHEVEIHSSRAKTCKEGIVGNIAKTCTLLQIKLNGLKVKRENIHFYENDESKIAGIIASNPTVVFDDKLSIIESLNNVGIKTMCVTGNHNKELETSKMTNFIEKYDKDELLERMGILLGVKKLECYNRAAASLTPYKVVKSTLYNAYNKMVKPCVLNKENLVDNSERAVIICPNHVRTLDPMILNYVIDDHVHWVALKRFFDGEDSIFNNSKWIVARKFTAYIFKELEFFPIDRDNPSKTVNVAAIKDMLNFLSIKERVGIFPEGTTRKVDFKFFNEFDENFLVLAKKSKAYVQPIGILWIREFGLENEVIINVGEPFVMDDISKEDGMIKYYEVQDQMYWENVTCLKEMLLKSYGTLENLSEEDKLNLEEFNNYTIRSLKNK